MWGSSSISVLAKSSLVMPPCWLSWLSKSLKAFWMSKYGFFSRSCLSLSTAISHANSFSQSSLYRSWVSSEKSWLWVFWAFKFLGFLACSSASTYYDLGTKASQNSEYLRQPLCSLSKCQNMRFSSISEYCAQISLSSDYISSSRFTSPVPLWSKSLKASTVLNSGHSLTSLCLNFSISNSFSDIITNRFWIVVYCLKLLKDLPESAARRLPGLTADLS